MNYYIDFDNTLFNTPLLTNAMLGSIVDTVHNSANIESSLLEAECKLMFNREHIYNIYELANYFADKYNVSSYELKLNINKTINEGNNFLFEDSIPFLEKLKKTGHKIHILTYDSNPLQYQISKLAGSKLADLFDSIIITRLPKYELDINYENGIFIDDNPKDLLGLYSKNPIQVIRLRRVGNKYSVTDLDINIKEYKTLDEIPIV